MAGSGSPGFQTGSLIPALPGDWTLYMQSRHSTTELWPFPSGWWLWLSTVTFKTYVSSQPNPRWVPAAAVPLPKCWVTHDSATMATGTQMSYNWMDYSAEHVWLYSTVCKASALLLSLAGANAMNPWFWLAPGASIPIICLWDAAYTLLYTSAKLLGDSLCIKYQLMYQMYQLSAPLKLNLSNLHFVKHQSTTILQN